MNRLFMFLTVFYLTSVVVWIFNEKKPPVTYYMCHIAVHFDMIKQ